jgi:putative hydrolase of the HAD superfamily
MPTGIRAIIYDLDNTLFPPRALPPAALAPVIHAVAWANEGTLSPAMLAAAMDECWADSLDSVAAKWGFSARMLAAGRAAYADVKIPETLEPYPDVPVIATIPAMRFLVTTGCAEIQRQKLAALRIGHLFDEVHIASGEGEWSGKGPIFRELLERHGLHHAELAVVGDNPDAELAAGGALGMFTVQVLREGVRPSTRAHRHIRSLTELPELLRAHERTMAPSWRETP